MNSQQLNEAIARVLVSTNTKKRQFSLFDVAEDLSLLKKHYGSMQKVSELVNIKPGMLNSFLSVFKLPDDVLKLVKTRKIDSVYKVYSLSKLSAKDASALATVVVTDNASSEELRTFVPYRKQFPNEPVEDVFNRFKKSKNIKVSVIRLPKTSIKSDTEKIKATILQLVGENNFLDIVSDEHFIDLKITQAGEKLLRQTAKTQRRTLQELISEIIQ
jgi:hypothetical protein